MEVISKRVEELEEENRQLRRSVVNLETNLSLAVAKQNTNETAPSVKS